jgi:phosphocarrier protein
MKQGVVIEQEFIIANELGLHARAATRLVQTASRFASEVTIEKDGQRVNGKSIMGVLMLVAAKGTTIRIQSKGEDAREVMDALGQLIQNKFGED